jgi:hypothetical protein
MFVTYPHNPIPIQIALFGHGLVGNRWTSAKLGARRSHTHKPVGEMHQSPPRDDHPAQALYPWADRILPSLVSVFLLKLESTPVP